MGSIIKTYHMKLRLIIALILGFTASLTSVFAQKNEFSCGHSEMQQKLWDENPQMKADFEAFIQNAKSFEYTNGKKRAKLVIPIVFHIIHEYGVENISDAQVFDQMEILNKDFNKLNGDTTEVHPAFKDLIANCGFEFKLATKDPLGNCTNGINHIYSHLTNNASDNSKLNQWDRSKYLNVWVVKTIGKQNVAGYALFPGSAMFNETWMMDGIILKHEYIGKIGTSNVDRSRALTHEIGHYLGLPHVWGFNNSPEVECGDDFIEDTPVTKGYKSCPTKRSLANPQTCLTDLAGVFTLDSVKVNSGNIDSTNYNFSDSVKYSQLKAIGVSNNSTQSGVFSFDNWSIGGVDKDTTFVNQLGAIDLGKYYELKLKANKNHLLNISKIVFKTLRDTNGIKSIAVRSSADNFSSNLSIKSNNTKIARSINNELYIFSDTTKSFVSTVTLPSDNTFKDLADNNEVTFRIYAWNAEKSEGTFILDSLSIQGVTGAIENVENYMEYSYCSVMFTKKQAERMTAVLFSPISGRNNLHTAKNLEETGVLSAQTCKPVADFSVNLKRDNSIKGNLICKGSIVKFNDQSWGSTIKNLNWYFEGGSPETSNDANPEVVYTTAGYKKVRLIATNDKDESDTITKESYIYVSDDAPYYSGPIIEGFEKGLPWHWITENDNSRWSSVSSNGKSNSGAMKLQNYKNISDILLKDKTHEEDYYYYKRLAGSKQSIITPAIDLSNATDVNLTFDYSFATDAYIDSLITDKINVYTSTNCGESWSLKKTIAGPKTKTNSLTLNTLLTAGNFSGKDFAPKSDVLWKTFSLPINVTSKDSNTRVKIEFIASEYANNLFLDNISINGTLQIKESPLTAMDITVKPNPTSPSEGITINYTANNDAVTFELTDVQGKVIVSESNKTRNSNVEHTMRLENTLNSGYYYLKITQGNYSTTRKVVVL
jgi:hypothetical protein